MKRIIRIGERRSVLTWNGTVDLTRFELSSPEQAPTTGEASIVEVEPGIYSVLLGERSYEVKVTPSGDGWAVDVDGRHFVIESIDPRHERRDGSARGSSGPLRLSAPMPGKVVRVLVEPGQAVEAGQGLLVVEAMKMQNEIKAPGAGRVVSLHASPGATVVAGEVLVVVE